MHANKLDTDNQKKIQALEIKSQEIQQIIDSSSSDETKESLNLLSLKKELEAAKDRYSQARAVLINQNNQAFLQFQKEKKELLSVLQQHETTISTLRQIAHKTREEFAAQTKKSTLIYSNETSALYSKISKLEQINSQLVNDIAVLRQRSDNEIQACFVRVANKKEEITKFQLQKQHEIEGKLNFLKSDLSKKKGLKANVSHDLDIISKDAERFQSQITDLHSQFSTNTTETRVLVLQEHITKLRSEKAEIDRSISRYKAEISSMVQRLLQREEPQPKEDVPTVDLDHLKERIQNAHQTLKDQTQNALDRTRDKSELLHQKQEEKERRQKRVSSASAELIRQQNEYLRIKEDIGELCTLICKIKAEIDALKETKEEALNRPQLLAGTEEFDETFPTLPTLGDTRELEFDQKVAQLQDLQRKISQAHARLEGLQKENSELDNLKKKNQILKAEREKCEKGRLFYSQRKKGVPSQ